MEIEAIQTNLSSKAFALRVIESANVTSRKQVLGLSRALDLPSKFPTPSFNLSEGANLASIGRKPGDVGHLIQEFNPKGFQVFSLLSIRF